MNRYFDFNATTPMSDAARRAWLDATEKHWHNPSSLYRDAGIAKQKLEEARERLATLLGCDSGRIVFTSGATESNNALFASLAARLPPKARIAISAIEHPSVREAAREQGHSCPVTKTAQECAVSLIIIPVNTDGVVEPDAVADIIGTQ
jgi:cysteine desulfurase